jgi:hypothetical protein
MHREMRKKRSAEDRKQEEQTENGENHKDMQQYIA